MSDGALTTGHAVKRQPLLRLLSDERLVKLAAEGSTAAFTAIYERHHQAVYRYSRSILHSDHDARDVLQSTMLKAMEALAGETRKIALRPWLFRIAHNESISQLRSRPTDAPIDGADEIASLEADPEVRERLRALIADLDQLSIRQRSALVMRELNGLEFEEIGLALEASPEAAKQAVYEARLALHEFEEGREMTCEEVRRKISAEDRRLLRGRRVRGHLRSCESCDAFERATRARSSQLACIAPPLPAAAALGILNSLFGGGTGGGGIAALAGGGGGVAGLGGSIAAKLGVTGVLALGIGTAALQNGEPGPATAGAAPGAKSHGPASHGSQMGTVGDADPASAERARGSGDEGSPKPAARADGRSQGPRREGHGAGSDRSRDHGGAEPGDGRSHGDADRDTPDDPPASSGRHPKPDGAQTPPAPVGQQPAGGGASSDSHGGAASPGKSGRGRGPAGTPPGHGGTPPGHGGLPPGLGVAPPGHTDFPAGHGGLPPGVGGAVPGRGTP